MCVQEGERECWRETGRCVRIEQEICSSCPQHEAQASTVVLLHCLSSLIGHAPFPHGIHCHCLLTLILRAKPSTIRYTCRLTPFPPSQVPVIQVMLGQLGIVSSQQMFSLWRYVVVGATVAAAVLTPSTDPFTQALLAIPLVGLYMGGAAMVRVLEQNKLAAGAQA